MWDSIVNMMNATFTVDYWNRKSDKEKQSIMDEILPQSLLLLVTDDPSLELAIRDVLAPRGWALKTAGDTTTMFAAPELAKAAAIVVDLRANNGSRSASDIRSMNTPASGIPILVAGDVEARVDGAGGGFALPLDSDRFAALLEAWAGPLDAHRMRIAPFVPRYRLIRLVGLANADAMMTRFAAALKDAVDLSVTDPTRLSAHRLAGLSGMIGYSELSRLWSAVDNGVPEALTPAIAASVALLEELAGSG